MLKNPFANALLASLYIVAVALALQSFQTLSQKPDTIFAPITMISLLVLSVSIMGLLFVYTPLKMFLENQKEEALTFFLKTIGTFACLVALSVVLLFLF